MNSIFVIFKKFVTISVTVLTLLWLCSNCNIDPEKMRENTQSKKKENCNSIKMEILLNNLLKKSFLFPKTISVEEKYYNDTTISYYLRFINFTMPKQEFYVHTSNPITSDSIKLILVDTMMSKGRQIGVKILEKNEDTSEIKISIGFGANGIASSEGIYWYEFNSDSCIWILKDSTFWQY